MPGRPPGRRLWLGGTELHSCNSHSAFPTEVPQRRENGVGPMLDFALGRVGRVRHAQWWHPASRGLSRFLGLPENRTGWPGRRPSTPGATTPGEVQTVKPRVVGRSGGFRPWCFDANGAMKTSLPAGEPTGALQDRPREPAGWTRTSAPRPISQTPTAATGSVSVHRKLQGEVWVERVPVLRVPRHRRGPGRPPDGRAAGAVHQGPHHADGLRQHLPLGGLQGDPAC